MEGNNEKMVDAFGKCFDNWLYAGDRYTISFAHGEDTRADFHTNNSNATQSHSDTNYAASSSLGCQTGIDSVV